MQAKDQNLMEWAKIFGYNWSFGHIRWKLLPTLAVFELFFSHTEYSKQFHHRVLIDEVN